MNLSVPNRQQIEAYLQWALATGGPIGGWIVGKFGEDALTQIMSTAMYFVPPLVSIIWAQCTRTEAAQIKAAKGIRGVRPIEVDTLPGRASPGAMEAVRAGFAKPVKP